MFDYFLVMTPLPEVHIKSSRVIWKISHKLYEMIFNKNSICPFIIFHWKIQVFNGTQVASMDMYLLLHLTNNHLFLPITRIRHISLFTPYWWGINLIFFITITITVNILSCKSATMIRPPPYLSRKLLLQRMQPPQSIFKLCPILLGLNTTCNISL